MPIHATSSWTDMGQQETKQITWNAHTREGLNSIYLEFILTRAADAQYDPQGT
jgi:hypothetical protein